MVSSSGLLSFLGHIFWPSSISFSWPYTSVCMTDAGQGVPFWGQIVDQQSSSPPYVWSIFMMQTSNRIEQETIHNALQTEAVQHKKITWPQTPRGQSFIRKGLAYNTKGCLAHLETSVRALDKTVDQNGLQPTSPDINCCVYVLLGLFQLITVTSNRKYKWYYNVGM